jgi:hypothetical protein
MVKPITFCHVPKTGGTSIHRMLAGWVGSNSITEQLKSDNYSVVTRAWGHMCVISGHFWFRPGETLDRDRLNVTLLRNPIDRILSHFYYVRSLDPTLHPSAPERSLDLPAYAFSELPSVRSALDNFQTRLLAPLGLSPEIREAAESDLLPAAIRALDSFDLVGIFPELVDTADLIACLARIATDGELPLPHERATEGRPSVSDLSSDVRKQLERRNEMDLELYAHVARRFKQTRRQLFLNSINAVVARESSSGEITQVAQVASSESLAARTPRADRVERPPPESSAPNARFGNRDIEVVEVIVQGELSIGSAAVMAGENVTISVRVAAHVSADDLTIGLHLHDSSGRLAFGTNSWVMGRRFSVVADSIFTARFTFRNVLGIGKYSVGVSLHPGISHLTCCYDWSDEFASIDVVGAIGTHFEGAVSLALSADVSSIQGAPPVMCDVPDYPHLVRVARHNPAVKEVRGRIRPLTQISAMRSGDLVSIEIEVESNCDQTLECDGLRPVRVCYRWLDSAGVRIQAEGIRTNLGIDIPAGAIHRAWITVTPPREFVGNSILRLVPVQENVAWFDEAGAFYVDIPVVIYN